MFQDDISNAYKSNTLPVSFSSDGMDGTRNEELTVRAPRRQGVCWIATVPYAEMSKPTELPLDVVYLKGQLEQGESTDYKHWQFVFCLSKKKSLAGVRKLFGRTGHFELTVSKKANEYVWKDDTSLGERFELGKQSFQRNSKHDWDQIWLDAVSGSIETIPASIRVTSYRTLRAIGADYDQPFAAVRSCRVYWGATGTGKSRLAHEQAGLVDTYVKDPCTKFWCGYRGEGNVIIDEFRGRIDISHLLRWLDRYPIRVEIKGSSRPLRATRFWITSNVGPDEWYPEADHETRLALLRRLEVTHFPAIEFS